MNNTMADPASPPVACFYPHPDPIMEPYPVRGKVAMVTGGGFGMGFEIARHLHLKARCRVVIVDYRFCLAAEALFVEQSLDDQNDEPPTSDIKAMRITLDMTSWDEIEKGWCATLATFKRIDILIHACGTGLSEPPSNSFWQPPWTERAFQNTWEAENDGRYSDVAFNIDGPIRLSQLAVTYWMTHEIKGNLFCLASTAGHQRSFLSPLHAAGRAAISEMIRSLGRMRSLCGIRTAALWIPRIYDAGGGPPGPQPRLGWEDPEDFVPTTAAECVESVMAVLQGIEYGDGNVLQMHKTGVNRKESETHITDLTRSPRGSFPSITLEGSPQLRAVKAEERRVVERLKEHGPRFALHEDEEPLEESDEEEPPYKVPDFNRRGYQMDDDEPPGDPISDSSEEEYMDYNGRSLPKKK